MLTITLQNDYHNTIVNLRPTPYDGDDRVIGKLTKNQVITARRNLCGVKDCCCGDDLGCRGPQDYDIEPIINHRTGNIIGAWVYEAIS